LCKKGDLHMRTSLGLREKSQRQQLRQMTEKVGRLKGLEFGPPFT
jgi:hypothetical protein